MSWGTYGSSRGPERCACDERTGSSRCHAWRITSIESFERDVRPGLEAIAGRLSEERSQSPLGARLTRFVSREDVGFTENVRHFLRVRLRSLSDRLTRELLDTCIIDWYALVVRTNGDVAPCCILQGKSLGNIYRQ